MKNRYWWLNKLTNRNLAAALSAVCDCNCPFFVDDEEEECQCKCDCITEVAIWLGEEHKE